MGGAGLQRQKRREQRKEVMREKGRKTEEEDATGVMKVRR